jgi:hypothetical protein
MTWQSNHEADMFMTVLSFPPSYSSLSAISAYLSAPIHKDSHGDENPVHGEQARPVLFFMLWPTSTKEEALDQA